MLFPDKDTKTGIGIIGVTKDAEFRYKYIYIIPQNSLSVKHKATRFSTIFSDIFCSKVTKARFFLSRSFWGW